MSTTLIHPRNALIHLAWQLTNNGAIADEQFNPLLQSISTLTSPNYLDLDRVAEIQKRISILTPAQQDQLTQKLDQIVTCFFTGKEDWEPIKSIEDTRQRVRVIDVLLMFPKAERNEMIGPVVALFNGISDGQQKDVFSSIELITMEQMDIKAIIQRAVKQIPHEIFLDRSSLLMGLVEVQ